MKGKRKIKRFNIGDRLKISTTYRYVKNETRYGTVIAENECHDGSFSYCIQFNNGSRDWRHPDIHRISKVKQ